MTILLWIIAAIILLIGSIVFFGYPFYAIWFRISKGKWPERKRQDKGSYIE